MVQVTECTKGMMHTPTHNPKAICPSNVFFFKLGGLKKQLIKHSYIQSWSMDPDTPGLIRKGAEHAARSVTRNYDNETGSMTDIL